MSTIRMKASFLNTGIAALALITLLPYYSSRAEESAPPEELAAAPAAEEMKAPSIAEFIRRTISNFDTTYFAGDNGSLGARYVTLGKDYRVYELQLNAAAYIGGEPQKEGQHELRVEILPFKIAVRVDAKDPSQVSIGSFNADLLQIDWGTLVGFYAKVGFLGYLHEQHPEFDLGKVTGVTLIDFNVRQVLDITTSGDIKLIAKGNFRFSWGNYSYGNTHLDGGVGLILGKRVTLMLNGEKDDHLANGANTLVHIYNRQSVGGSLDVRLFEGLHLDLGASRDDYQITRWKDPGMDTQPTSETRERATRIMGGLKLTW
jgi:hypothetical protein